MGIYKTPTIYKTGAGGGGGDISPDIPEDFKEYYTEINSLATTGNKFITCNDLNFKSTDVFILELYPWRAIDNDSFIIKGYESANGTGNIVFGVRGDSAYYPNIASAWVQNSGGEKNTSYSVVYYNLYKYVLNNSNFYINNSLKTNAVPIGTKTNGTCIRIFHNYDRQCWAIKSVQIIDKDSLYKKIHFVPCKENATGQLGFLEIVSKRFFYSNSAGFFEYIPA